MDVNASFSVKVIHLYTYWQGHIGRGIMLQEIKSSSLSICPYPGVRYKCNRNVVTLKCVDSTAKIATQTGKI